MQGHEPWTLNNSFSSERGGVHIRPLVRHSDPRSTCSRPYRQPREPTMQIRGKSSLLRFVLFLFQVFRYGEASHPGPCQGFVIGLLNPTGLLNKADLINTLPQGSHGTVWTVSETHLTKGGCAQFRRSLLCTRSPYKLIHGEFVPPKTAHQSFLSVRGKERGVGFLSSTPGRSLMHDWPQEVSGQQRCHVAGFQMGLNWLQGGVFYGSAFHSSGLPTRDSNNQLFSHLVERIDQNAYGPRFIGGDFNHFLDELPAVQTLLHHGWEEAQSIAKRRFGQAIQPTIQQKHTKDLLLLSPELVPLVTEVHVEHDWVANHAIVYVVLRPDAQSIKVPIWKKPRRVDWELHSDRHTADNQALEAPQETTWETDDTGSADDRYQAIWHSFESQMVECARQHGRNIHNSQTGRGATRNRSWITEQYVPLRPSRPGSFTPTFHGQSVAHTHWVRQLRRLQALAHMHHARHVPNAQWQERKLGQWRAIKKAVGFKPSFEQWWASKAKHVLGLPQSLPLLPPDGEIARLLAIDFQKDVLDFETLLKASRIKQAKQCRLDDPSRIFRDLQAPHSEPVHMLLAHTVATVEAVDHEECALVLDSANAFHPEQPIEYNGKPLPLVHNDTDKLWLEHMPPVQAGDSVTQTQPLTDLAQIYEAFQSEWMARWDRHAKTDDSKWEPIIDFVRIAIPNPPTMPYHPISHATWQQAVSKKKTRAAIGPDGVAKEDLVALPWNHVEPILRLLEDIEQGRSLWPQQIVTGHIHALEKLPGAWKASQYRPLTVFSLVYRTWSSIRARETLAYLGQFVPEQVTGNIPGKSCTDLWLSIQLLLEDSTAAHVPVTGVVADLVKAYNLLPRLPLLAIGVHLGLPKPIVRAWANALKQMARSFSIRGTIGPPLQSSTGFAEGCGMSCSAMLLCNIALSRWIQIRYPPVRLWSYVDNLEITAGNMADARIGLGYMTQFCELMDLQLDSGKTYFWSNDAAERKQARLAEQPLESSARDLGAHMEYGRRNTNHVLRGRLQAMPRIWDALARSLAPYRQKAHALRAKGWPQALSMGTSASLGDVHLRSLRTGACKGLRVHAPGMSPMIHLSLVEHPLTDPGCYLLVQTVQVFRRHANSDQVSGLIEQVLRDWTELPARPGPSHVLLERLNAIGWRWLSDGWVLDHEAFPVDLLHGSHSEVHHRLLEGWQSFVQGCVSKRKTFQGMEWINAALTLEHTSKLAPSQLGLLRKIFNGTFFTADTQTHNKKAHTISCKFCGHPDSQFHRFWECSHFERSRPFPWLTQKILEGGLPKCLTYHGWIGLPQSVRDLQRLLCTQPALTSQFDAPPFRAIDLFIDGSCVNPTCQFTRLAGWSVIAADPSDVDRWWPIAQGLVSGRRQTSGRAEISAAISAVRYTLTQDRPMRIWCDNAQVVGFLQTALRNPDISKIYSKDQDLWSELLSVARTVPASTIQIIKITSHQNRLHANWIDLWAYTGNDNADHGAQWSLIDTGTVRSTWLKAVEDLDAARVLRDQIHATMLRVSEDAVTRDVPAPADDPPQTAYPLPVPEPTLPILPLRPQTVTHKLVGPGWDCISGWSRSLQTQTAPVVHIPWLYLLIDFVLSTGDGGVRPSRNFSSWQWLTREDAKEFDLQDRIKWFRLFLIRIHKLEGCPLSTNYLRPTSRTTLFWAHCVTCRMEEGRFKQVESFIHQFKASLQCGADLGSIAL